MPRFSDIGALRVLDPTAWKKKIKETMAETGGRATAAAKLLGISERLMYRWLAQPILSDIKRVAVGEPINGKRGQKALIKEMPSRRKKSA